MTAEIKDRARTRASSSTADIAPSPVTSPVDHSACSPAIYLIEEVEVHKETPRTALNTATVTYLAHPGPRGITDVASEALHSVQERGRGALSGQMVRVTRPRTVTWQDKLSYWLDRQVETHPETYFYILIAMTVCVVD